MDGDGLKLGRKVALSQLGVGMIAVLMIYGLMVSVWVKNYEQLEQTAVHANIRRTQLLWEREMDGLASIIGDWAPWDDLHAFASRSGNADFMEKNLQDSSMANLRIDFAVITDPAGTIFAAKAIDMGKKQIRDLPKEVQFYIQPDQAFLAKIGEREPLKGILWLDGKPAMVSAQRILRSDYSGPSPGILFFIRLIDEQTIGEMAEIIQIPLRIEPDYQGVINATDPITAEHRHELLGDSIHRVYLPVQDLYGNIRFALTIETPRLFVAEARKQTRAFIVFLILLISSTAILSTQIMRWLVGRRLEQVDQYLKQIEEIGERKERLEVSGQDELSQVAASINQMLDRIAASNREIEQMNRSLQLELEERHKAEAVLKYSSEHDALTGLHNRAYFEAAMLNLKKSGATGVGIICCDLDGLKLINDTLGHVAGDEMLRRTAEILRHVVAENAVTARIGGDEFVVLLTGIEEGQLEALAKQVQRLAGEYSANIAEQFPLQISVGYRYRPYCEPGASELDQMLKEADDDMYRQKLSSTQSNRNVVVQTIMKMLEIRDFATEGHSQRMAELSVALADWIGLSPQSKNDILLLAQFHDIGKIGVSDKILLKPGPLTPEERKEMERHSEIGHRIAMAIPEFLPVADLILKHHEWWNGQGYPLGLRAETIPVENRIISITDAYDAMTSDRPYRKAMSHEQAAAELVRCKGSQFDPHLVDRFLVMMEQSGLAPR